MKVLVFQWASRTSKSPVKAPHRNGKTSNFPVFSPTARAGQDMAAEVAQAGCGALFLFLGVVRGTHSKWSGLSMSEIIPVATRVEHAVVSGLAHNHRNGIAIKPAGTTLMAIGHPIV